MKVLRKWRSWLMGSPNYDMSHVWEQAKQIFWSEETLDAGEVVMNTKIHGAVCLVARWPVSCIDLLERKFPKVLASEFDMDHRGRHFHAWSHCVKRDRYCTSEPLQTFPAYASRSELDPNPPINAVVNTKHYLSQPWHHCLALQGVQRFGAQCNQTGQVYWSGLDSEEVGG